MTLAYGVQIKVSRIAGKLDIGFAISADWNRMKQMNKQEAIEKVTERMKQLNMGGAIWVKKDDVIEIISQVHEPQKPVVPKFVGEWLEGMKQDERPLYGVISRLMNKTNHEWDVWKSANMNFSEIVAQAWIDGYTVEQEKLYIVEIPNPNGVVVCLERLDRGKIALSTLGESELTEAEIKQDFEWAWQWAKEVE